MKMSSTSATGRAKPARCSSLAQSRRSGKRRDPRRCAPPVSARLPSRSAPLPQFRQCAERRQARQQQPIRPQCHAQLNERAGKIDSPSAATGSRPPGATLAGAIGKNSSSASNRRSSRRAAMAGDRVGRKKPRCPARAASGAMKPAPPDIERAGETDWKHRRAAPAAGRRHHEKYRRRRPPCRRLARGGGGRRGGRTHCAGRIHGLSCSPGLRYAPSRLRLRRYGGQRHETHRCGGLARLVQRRPRTGRPRRARGRASSAPRTCSGQCRARCRA